MIRFRAVGMFSKGDRVTYHLREAVFVREYPELTSCVTIQISESTQWTVPREDVKPLQEGEQLELLPGISIGDRVRGALGVGEVLEFLPAGKVCVLSEEKTDNDYGETFRKRVTEDLWMLEAV